MSRGGALYPFRNMTARASGGTSDFGGAPMTRSYPLKSRGGRLQGCPREGRKCELQGCPVKAGSAEFGAAP